MDIDEKVEIARRHARMIVNAENWRGRANGRTDARPNSRVAAAYAILDVCDALEAERNRSKAAGVVDLLADLAGDGRNGTR